MSTTASLTFKNKNQKFKSDGYPSNVIPAIMGIKAAVLNGESFDSTIHNYEPLQFKNRPDSTTNYIYSISDDFTELSLLGYDKTADVVVLDLDVLFDIFTKDMECFTNTMADISDYVVITPEDLEMSTDEFMSTYNGNAFDYAFHSMAKCIVKRIETNLEIA